MLEEKIEKAEEAKRKTPKQTTKYSIEELIQAAKTVFGVQSECVVAAFLLANKNEATQEEANKIIKEFMSKEVK